MIEGVSGPTKRVGKNNFEVRIDGFGTMSDEDVEKYKKARPGRYLPERIAAIERRLVALEGVP